MTDCNLPWSDKTSIVSLHEKLDDFGTPIRERNFIQELSKDSNAKCWRIRMSVVDSQNCHGPLVNTTISLKPQEHSKNVSCLFHSKYFIRNDLFPFQITFQLIMICVAAGICTVASVLLVIYGCLWKNRKKNIVNYWRGLYQNIQHG